ncbi:MAG: DUF3368 domain-containing protein [Desulfococcaceae bacterium]|jgi:predicted nucleic acid-binding protein|nr:DUF3368 domain-containing protein [Desulfococcaceae bacterium]
MIIVSNTSPIINLAAIRQMDLLKQLYEKIIIPQAVFEEIAVIGAGQAGSEEVKTSDWIETRQVNNRFPADSLQSELDAGEAEAIALALEIKADMILMDERRGRQAASRLGLRCLGLMGILTEAKHRKLIQAVKPMTDCLMKEAGFWIDQKLYQYVLQINGE